MRDELITVYLEYSSPHLFRLLVMSKLVSLDFKRGSFTDAPESSSFFICSSTKHEPDGKSSSHCFPLKKENKKKTVRPPLP